jgi:hypothetical protein
MANHDMILEKHTAVRIGRVHDGKVMVMRSPSSRTCGTGSLLRGKPSLSQQSIICGSRKLVNPAWPKSLSLNLPANS